jgi:transporter family-2 protein
MNNNLLLILLALITGALIPIQAATNSAFSKSIGNPFITGFMVFAVGIVAIAIFLLLKRVPFPPTDKLIQAPLYGYAGGLIVATYVIIITYLSPKIGVATAIGFIVTGQILCAVIIDHFGLFNVAVRTVSFTRLLGVLLMISGVYMVMKKGPLLQ